MAILGGSNTLILRRRQFKHAVVTCLLLPPILLIKGRISGLIAWQGAQSLDCTNSTLDAGGWMQVCQKEVGVIKVLI